MSIALLDMRLIGNLAQSICFHFDIQSDKMRNEVRQNLKKLFLANNNCYAGRYKDTPILTNVRLRKPNGVYKIRQCVKTLECLRYNIEKEYLKYTIDDELKYLSDVVTRLQLMINLSKEPYHETEWLQRF